MKRFYGCKTIGILCALGTMTASAGPCSPPASYPSFPPQPGYVDFIAPSDLAPFKAAMPQVVDPKVNEAIHSASTIWYDEKSMVYSYQDSIEEVVGLRANCVARVVGETNDYPISKLTNYFGSDYKFLYPFKTVAGTDNVSNVKALNFWVPPKSERGVLPVKYWRPTNRGRWRWTFPIGTLFGEVLFEQSPDGRWYPFEVRMRKRYIAGWSVDVFRPFDTAESLANAIGSAEPDWALSSELADYVQYLRNKNTLVAHHLESSAYGTVFPAIDGALDPLPALSDSSLIARLLTQTPFVSVEGSIWKENGSLETYAPSSQGDFNIVPKGYEMGMIAVNEVSCARCHDQTGRKLGHFDFDVQAYGEVWGEDHIFTWHLFQPNDKIYGTFDDADDPPSRILNDRLVQAGLVKEEVPTSGDNLYQALQSAFDDPADSNIQLPSRPEIHHP